MTVYEILKYLDKKAPIGSAFKNDNPGLQIGNTNDQVKGIYFCLDLDSRTLKEAIDTKSNLIITHHPFFFRPLKNINYLKDSKAQLIQTIIKYDINVISLHTNYDFSLNGVSFVLAKMLKLKNVKFLENHKENQLKLVVYIPEENLENLSNALFSEGAGIIGNYSKCSFRTKGKGTFEGNENSNPTIGRNNTFETINEIKAEFIINEWDQSRIISVLRSVHPYEEPAYDILPLKNNNVNFGAGAFGEYDNPIKTSDFFTLIANSLGINNFRYCNYSSDYIKRVAVCGGSGSDLLNSAISAKADAFITADIKYHTFQDAENKILLIDAGHYETEIPAVKELLNITKNFIDLNGENIPLNLYTVSTNPIKFYK